MARIAASKSETSLAQSLDRVARKRERIVVRRNGKNVAAIVPMEDLAALEELEDRRDLRVAKKALAEAKKKGEKPIPWAKAKKELGL